MKKNITLVLCATSLWANMLTSSTVSLKDTHIQASGSAQIGNIQAQTVQPVVVAQTNMANVTSFISEHKKEVALLAVAITIGLSLKYCSWMQGIVGIDTEDEIDDWRVFIQD